MRKFTTSRVRSFGHALQGWWYVLRTQRNAWLHVGITLAVFALSFWLELDTLGWAVIVITTALVFGAEFFNTSLEVVVDLVSPQEHPLAKVGKDVAAGAVFLTALAAIFIGILVLGPPFLIRLETILRR